MKWKTKNFRDMQVIREDTQVTTYVFLKQLLVEFRYILRPFYHLRISWVLFTHSFIDAFGYAEVRLNYTYNYFF